MYLSIPVEEIMVTDVVTEPPQTTAADAARTLRENGVGSVVVVRDGTPVGIVTEGDFVRHLYRLDDLGSVEIEDVMSTPLTAVDPETPIVDAAEILRANELEHLPVVDSDGDESTADSSEERAEANGELVGIVTASELSYFLPQLLRPLTITEAEPTKQPVRSDTQYERESWTFDYHGADTTSVAVGDVATFSKRLTDEDVEEFAEATGDTNRVHLDAAYAAETRFGERIGHGILTTGLVSATLARLPGLTIYLSQEMTFLGPVTVGDRATARCEILEELGERQFRVKTSVFDEEDEKVLDGEAVVLVDPLPTTATVEGTSETDA